MEQGRSNDAKLSYPFRRQHPLEPAAQLPPLLRQKVADRVRLYDGREVWLVTRHEDVRLVLLDERFSNDLNKPGYPKLSPGDGKAHETNVSFLHHDNPRHRELRGMIGQHFTPRATEALRPLVLETVGQLIDDMLSQGPPADLLDAIGRPLPTLVICHLLGVPYDKRPFFDGCVRTSLASGAPPEEKREAARRLRDYFGELVRLRMKEPGTDMISGLVTDYLSKGAATFEDVVSTAQLMLIGGLETTTNAIGLGFLELRRCPGMWEVVGQRPEMVALAVEETLRFQTIFDLGLTRVATEDVRLGCGTLVRAGEGIVASLTSANRDPDVFERPDEFEPSRISCPHLAFGVGTHYCIGHSLARLELQVAFAELTRRVPTLDTQVPAQELRFKHDSSMYGPDELPVIW